MNATVTYQLQFIPHPWNEKSRKEGVSAWCLVRVMTPELGPRKEEPVAIFNLDSEAELFASHVFATKLDKKLVDIGRDFEQLCRLREKR